MDQQSGPEGLDKQLKAIDTETCKKTCSYRAIWAMIMPTIPGIAAAFSIFAYVVTFSVFNQHPPWWTQVIAISGGTVFSLIVWVVVGITLHGFTAVDRANMSSYGYLLNRMYQLLPKLMILEAETQSQPNCASIACKKEILSLYQSIIKELKRPRNPAWMDGIGYINVWRCVHYIDEAFIEFEPEEDVLRDAIHDEMCIQGSTITNSKELLQKLRLAIMVLNKSGAKYLNDSPNQEINSHPSEQGQARAVIRQVRHELQQFRDHRWESLVRTRNELLKMTALTGLFLYFLCEFTIFIFPSDLKLIGDIAILFFIGAIAGLFSRLYSQSRTDVSIDDYQLTFARLMATPLYSGLAALGGVFIVQKIGLFGNVTTFDISPQNILIAATFGLTPILFMNAIQNETEQYKKDLKSTEAPGGTKS